MRGNTIPCPDTATWSAVYGTWRSSDKRTSRTNQTCTPGAYVTSISYAQLGTTNLGDAKDSFVPWLRAVNMTCSDGTLLSLEAGASGRGAPPTESPAALVQTLNQPGGKDAGTVEVVFS